MARKTNYSFERRQREIARSHKKAERLRAKQEKSDLRKEDSCDGESEPDSAASRSTGSPE